MAETVYHRITITGDPGSGKSTFAAAVQAKTGYKLITTGNMFRALAAKKGVSVTELNEMAATQGDIDKQVDDYIKSLNHEKDHLILDSRMAWHFIRHALKIRLTVDPDVAVRRIYNDKETKWRERFPDMETAMEDVRRRRESEVWRYNELYGVDISDPANFDIVINTSHITPDETLAQFEDAFKKYLDYLETPAIQAEAAT